MGFSIFIFYTFTIKMKVRPLKKEDVIFIKEGDGKVNFCGWYAIPLVTHELAVEWVRQ